MQSKLVENWLTNAKELSFTTPFVQLLVSEGYRVIHVSRGGAVEQGKDIIAYAPDGNIHCYQLKCGDIPVKEWYKIKSQIDELVQIPPVNSAINTTPKSWRCFLVTNGSIPNATARTIADYSAAMSSNGFMPIETLTKEQLQKRFSDGFNKFFPVEPQEIRTFFEIYCEHGDNEIDKESFKRLFEDYFAQYDNTRSKQKKLEAIQGSLILCSYLLTNKYICENYTAIINAWLLLLFTILHYAHKWQLDFKKLISTEDIIESEIEQIFRLLVDDIASHDKFLVDTEHGQLSEGILVYRIRCAQLLGYLTGYINYNLLKGSVPYLPEGATEKITLMTERRFIIGEMMMPYVFNIILLHLLLQMRDKAVEELLVLVQGILETHEDGEGGLISPYYSIKQAIENKLGVTDEITETFEKRSYTLWPAVLMLAKLGQREFLNDNWPLLSYISREQVIAKQPNDLLLWKVENADMQDTFPDAEQSWKALVDEANKNYDSDIPEELVKRRRLLPLFILVMPHRVSPPMILSIINKP